MKYKWMDEFLRSKQGVTKDLKKEWNWIRYMIGDKMLAAICLDENDVPYYITLKLEPSGGEFLRTKYEDIVPGYYMNKLHWNSIRPDGEVPDDLLKDLLDKSYQLVLEGFSKKRQKEILALESQPEALSCCGTACKSCEYYGALCKGCNESRGKVFHAPEGQVCPIYQCSIHQHQYRSCKDCDSIPCDIWRKTKDPSLSPEEFEQTIKQRMERLKGENDGI